MNKIRGAQAGFTLIELVVVIVILGILAATALPKFVDLSDEAGTAAANGVAGAIASGSATNYAAKVAGKTDATILNAADVCTVALLGNLVKGVEFKASGTALANGNEFTVAAGSGSCASTAASGTTPAASSAGNTVTCKIKGYKGAEVNATVVCTGA